ncbi:MAG: hypothetical protein UW86_C0005G0021 [Microgenomates group bacterium GW2011_GWA1_Microgenomates_45_10]|nr:MAG: hypothetical protein UW69_C0005G0021 [Microgenomates group bacterium GW2011_GWA2_44_7]KKT77611.1 MAG: hypothetical protein UW73_C0016G0021 [Microgenomates group bacterium GW2011_GWB1_44_8]KKT87280.1 MAG: hypothetical protein UW86_C0005G0021 [Microgenomates group bacterium GW2011_GWA1_Microgenomates_45_10]
MVDIIKNQRLKLRDKREEPSLGSSSRVEGFLINLGLSPEESAVYRALVNHGISSTLKLARTTTLPRTNVYRILENLKKLGLVEEVVQEKKRLTRIADPSRLEFLISQQKEKTKALENLFPEVKSLLTHQTSGQQPSTEVLFYKGRRGIEQQIWNELMAKGEIVGYTLLAFEDIIGKKLAQKYREERMIRNIKAREILADDDKYLSSETLEYVQHSPLFKNYDFRYLPKGKLNVTHNLIIYDDIVSIYNWHEGEVFGVEIHNQAVATMQKQIFDILWDIAQKPEVVLKEQTNTTSKPLTVHLLSACSTI